MPIKEGALTAPPAEQETQPKERRKRRTKAQIEADNIAAAKIPNDDDEVTVVFTTAVDTFEAGSTHALLWPDALRLAREDKVTLSDKHELARKRLDQEAKAKLDAEDAAFQNRPPETPSLGEKIPVRIGVTEFEWEWREVLKHVVFNHNDNLECVKPEHAAALERAQTVYTAEYPMAGPASLGTVEITDDILATVLVDRTETIEQATAGYAVDERKLEAPADPPPPASAPPAPKSESDEVTGDEEGGVSVEREGMPIAEQVQPGVWKVGMGFIEKIGLPDYSSLAIGPCTASSHVVDDGRRQTYEMKDRGTGLPVEVVLPVAVVEKLTEASNICEVVMRAERQSMINFLELVKGPSVQATAPPVIPPVA